ncbi:hypothetical protein DCAR_0416243 [Daucus carota subsp. sativus]|uniref:Uncharacterized protein n=1 Tax=Daucus carota subsp. sativus TaxID=79200 RepID=A0A165XAI0_DAUCS|nr:PREDICTED: uncharacterized protein LOC108218209 [Daucus carota subsp. sativus]WOG96905.1 hypothetical protein DCAR_0416243 [Daucus carota subsp. sativus]
MEAATLSSCKISHSLAPLMIPQTTNYSVNTKLPQTQKKLIGCTSTKLWHGKRACGLVMGCAKSGGGSLTEMEAKIKSERDSDFEGKCQGKEGIVELMECLESEAIMGEDEGKDASDYNRRAKIFDKSAQVFQALKEETEESREDA